MSKIIITSKMNTETAIEVIEAINNAAEKKIATIDNISIENRMLKYTSGINANEFIEAIEIDSDKLIGLIKVIGSVIKTVKPMLDMFKNMSENWANQIDALIGHNKKTVNGREIKDPCMRGSKRYFDGCTVEVKAWNAEGDEDEALSRVDGVFKKLGF